MGKEDFFAFFAQSHSKYEQEEQTNMTNLKKKLAVLLALCLMLGALPLSALAARYKLTLADGTTEVGELTTNDETGKIQSATLNAPYDYYGFAPEAIVVDGQELTAYYDGAPTALKFTPRLVSEPVVLTFAKGTETTDSIPATVMGDITVAQTEKTVTVTGTAPYEKDGHYLLVKIDTSANATITLNGSDVELTAGTAATVAIKLDDATTGIITVPVKGTSDTYTIDFTGVTLLPHKAAGTTVEVTEGEDGEKVVEISKGDDAGVALPETLGTDTALGSVEVKVDTVSKPTDDKIASTTPAAIKTAIGTQGAQFVEVTIVTIGDTTPLFAEKDALRNTPVTITIGNLTAGTQYYVFCIMDDGTVTSYGYVTPSGATLSFTTKHLCVFGAAPVTEATKDALMEAVKADTANHEADTQFTGAAEGGVVLPDAGTEEPETGIQAKFTAKASLEGTDVQTYYYGKLELKGLTPEGWYLVAFDNGNAKPVSGSNVYPRTCIVGQADGNGEASMICQPGMFVSVYALHAGDGVPYVIPASFADADSFGLDKNNKGVSVNSLTSFTTLAPHPAQ